MSSQPQAPAEAQTVTADDGVEIAYAVHGSGDTTLLLMHGWAGSGGYFAPTIGHLDLTRLRAITLDLRGHGRSGKPEQGYSDERFARDALTVADAVGAGPLIVVGFSMSARFAQYVTRLAPERVRGQVLVAGGPTHAFPFGEDLLAWWVEQAATRASLRALVTSWTTRPVADELIDAWVDDAELASAIALDAALRVVSYSSFPEAPPATQPTLVIGCVGDESFPPEQLRRHVADPLPQAQLHVVDCGHEIGLEAPHELAGLLTAFAAGLTRT